jgi:hypothetical protein
MLALGAPTPMPISSQSSRVAISSGQSLDVGFVVVVEFVFVGRYFTLGDHVAVLVDQTESRIGTAYVDTHCEFFHHRSFSCLLNLVKVSEIISIYAIFLLLLNR